MSKEGETPTILIIEDDADTLYSFGKTIEDAGFNVILANDRDSGISEAKEKIPNSIILDLGLPGSPEKKEGFEVLIELKKDSRTHNIPIIIVTSYVSEENRKRAHELQVAQYHEKPVSPAELIKAVTNLLPPGDVRPERTKS